MNNTLTRLLVYSLLCAGPQALNFILKDELISDTFQSAWLAVTIGLSIYTELAFQALKKQDTIISELHTAVKSIGNSVAVVRQLTAQEFHKDFLESISTATQLVWISYLSPKPLNPDNTDVKEYLRQLKKLIISRKNITFRRVVLDTPENRTWVKNIMNELKGKKVNNLEIYLLDQGEVDGDQYYAMAVQIIDTDKLWMVALNDHLSGYGTRDLKITSVEAVSMLKSYYDRLVKLSTCVFKDGDRINHG